MSNYLVEVLVGVVSTTVDDFVVQIYFLSKVMREDEDKRYSLYIQAFAGVMIAYTIINLLACSFLVLGTFLSAEYIALLGFVPLLMGLWQIHEGCEDKGLYDYCCSPCSTCCTSSSSDGEKKGEQVSFSALSANSSIEDSKPILTATGQSRKVRSSRRSSVSISASRRIGNYASGKFGSSAHNSNDNSRNGSDVAGMEGERGEYSFEELMREGRDGYTSTSYGTSNGNTNNEDEEEEEDGAASIPDHPLDEGELESTLFHCMAPCMAPLLTPFMFEVLMVTLAVSSDNIIVYAAMFTTMPTLWVLYGVGMIMTLIVLLFFIALHTSRIAIVNKCCTDYSGYVVPLLLIGLGLYILSGSVVWP